MESLHKLSGVAQEATFNYNGWLDKTNDPYDVRSHQAYQALLTEMAPQLAIINDQVSLHSLLLVNLD